MSTAATTTPNHSNYGHLYGDDTLDPLEGDYANVMSMFTTTSTSPRESEIYKAVFQTTDVQPHIYLLYTEDSQYGYVSVVHRLYRFTSPLGSQIPPADVCLLGDVEESTLPLMVKFPEHAFERTGEVEVYTAAGMDAAFAADPDLNFVGDFEEHEPETETVNTRRLMFLPPKYAKVILAQPRCSPRQAWAVLGGMIRAASPQEQTVMKPVLDWLRVSCTAHTMDGGSPKTKVDTPNAIVPPIAALSRRVTRMIHRDLPGWNQATGSDSTTRAVNNLTSELIRLETERARREQTPKAKDPNAYFGTATVAKLCRLSGVASQADLAPVFTEIASAPKRMERQAVQEAINQVADMLGLQSYAPIADTEITKIITRAEFVHHHLDDLDSGFHPFRTTPRSPSDLQQLQETLRFYDEMRAAAGGSIADLALLKAAQVIGIPYTMSQTTATLQSFRILLHTVLPYSHPMVTGWDTFCTTWVGHNVELETTLSYQEYGLVLRWCQLRISTWFAGQAKQPGPYPVPRFNELLSDILYKANWQPTMPAKYALTPPTPQVPATSAATANSDSTTTTVARAATATPARANTRINNANYDERFQEFKQLGLRLAKVRELAEAANKPVPKNARNTEHCLSYHIMGFCWEQCRRAEDHRTLSADESNTLHTWCRECYREGGP